MTFDPVEVNDVCRAATLLRAGRERAAAAAARAKRMGLTPPDRAYGLSEDELLAADMLNALQAENDELRQELAALRAITAPPAMSHASTIRPEQVLA